jgi:hypothetical protein
MSDRTVIAAVTDLLMTGLSVEQQILVNEIIAIASGLQAKLDADKERRGRHADRVRESRYRTVNHTPSSPSSLPPITPNPTTSPTPVFRSNPSESLFFEEFWKVYPRKVGKGEARKAYRNALKRATAEEILAGAKRYAESKPDPEFTKHPGPWLNADRWADEDPRKVVDFRMPAPRSWAEQKDEFRAKKGDTQ